MQYNQWGKTRAAGWRLQGGTESLEGTGMEEQCMPKQGPICSWAEHEFGNNRGFVLPYGNVQESFTNSNEERSTL